MTKNAMLPDYSNSGGKGKTKTLNKAKVGRPRKVSISNEYQTGINITDEVKFNLNTPLTSITELQITIR